ncbi:MAG: tetratricopeptide repeat protein [Candidatus Hermodarchaeota archaeon]
MTLIKSVGIFFIYCIWNIIGILIILFLFPVLDYFIGNYNFSYWLRWLVLGVWFVLPPFIKLILNRKKKPKSVNVEELTLDDKYSNYSPVELLNQGLIFLSRGSFEDAIDVFEKGIRKDSDNFELHFRKGKAFMALEYYENALECYEIAFDLNPEYSLILSNIEIVQYKLSKHSLPEDLQNELVDLIEDFYEYDEPSMIWNYNGAQLQMLGELISAYNYYKKALQINRKNLYAKRNIKRLRKIRMKEYEFSL